MRHAVREQHGTLAAAFRAFDRDGSGGISAEVLQLLQLLQLLRLL